jgi:hypothetical protein
VFVGFREPLRIWPGFYGSHNGNGLKWKQKVEISGVFDSLADRENKRR